ncbi:MAG: hypothetical protein ACI4D9_05700 [Lachnospiraceae bacterium]
MKKSIGLQIVGYRYGAAPENGKSYNYQTGEYECGVSMACVGYDKEIGSFAVSEAGNRKKFYYIGTICGTGGDDEICLRDVQRISYRQYIVMRKEMVDVSNVIVNERYDRKIALIAKGFNIGKSEEEIEQERKVYLR